jgi:CubicO group peptidase (beta-lactamase class C family)
MKRLLLVLSLLVACGGPATRVPKPTPISDEGARLGAKLDAVVQKVLAEAPHAGVSVVVVWKGEAVLEKGYGAMDLEAKTPAEADTIYRIGSITKSFTAVGILKLAAAGKLSIDDPVTTYLPDVDTHGATITIRHLLTHTSGIKGYTETAWFHARDNEAFPRSEMVKLVNAEPLLFEPGTRWSYSNSGYYFLGLVIEQVSGKPYAEFVRDEIVRPLGLADTAYCPREMTAPRHARAYTVKDDAVVPAEPLDMDHPYAAGSLCSTAPDLARWMQALAGGGALSAAEWAQMITPAALADGSTVPYGFGMGVGELGGHRSIGHGGGINGFTSHMAYLPDDELVIVVLNNTDSQLSGRLGDALAREALGVPEVQVKDEPLSAAQAAPFEGLYDFASLGFKLRATFKEGKLVVTMIDEKGEGRALALRWQGGNVFLVPEVGATITFTVEGDRATSLTVEQGGGQFTGTRIESEPPRP